MGHTHSQDLAAQRRGFIDPEQMLTRVWTLEDENVHIADEHAWWAARDELDSKKIPTGRTKKPVEEAPRHSSFEDYYSTESLFDWTGAQEGLFDESDPYIVLGLPPSASCLPARTRLPDRGIRAVQARRRRARVRAQARMNPAVGSERR